MSDCERRSPSPVPTTVTQTTSSRTRRASLQRMLGYLATVTDGALSLTAALAHGVGGDEQWKGLDLINGARYSDLRQALEYFDNLNLYGPHQCTSCYSERWRG